MATIANFNLTDEQATPVSHTFAAITANPNALWRDTVSGLSLIGQNTIEVLSNKFDRKLQLYRIRIQYACPALEIIAGNNAQGYTAQPKVGYVNKCITEWFLHARGTNQQRKDLRAFVRGSLIQGSQIGNFIDDLVVPT